MAFLREDFDIRARLLDCRNIEVIFAERRMEGEREKVTVL